MKSLRALVGFAEVNPARYLVVRESPESLKYDPPRETAGQIPRLMAGRRNNLEDWVTRMVLLPKSAMVGYGRPSQTERAWVHRLSRRPICEVGLRYSRARRETCGKCRCSTH